MGLWWLMRTWPMRRVLHRSISLTTRFAPHPPPGGRARVEGVDPLRVQLIGSGLAVGYGVAHQEDAIDGHLARGLAAASGRGVTVENLARHDAQILDQILTTGISDSLDLHDVVVWVPSSLEMCSRWWPRGWSSRLGELLEHLVRCRRVVILALPLAVGGSEFVAAGTEIARRVNRDLERVARRFPSVVVVDPPAVVVDVPGAPTLTSDYYRACADALVAVLAPRPSSTVCSIGAM